MLFRTSVFFLTLSLTAPSAPEARPPAQWALVITTAAVPLDPTNPASDAVGRLVYRAGLALTCSDRRFGGLSDLAVSEDGSRLLAVSDEGHWVRARLLYDERGVLKGLDRAEMGPLLDTNGQPLLSKDRQDAESLTQLPDGSWLVAFEHQHRVWSYPGGDRPLQGVARATVAPPGLEQGPLNAGLEALATLADGRILALSEDWGKDGHLHGWVGRDGVWASLEYLATGPERPTGTARLPSGDVLVVERYYSKATGVLIGLKRVAADAIKPGAALRGELLATIRPPLTADNFEGVATRRGSNGETLIYLLSDNNFNSKQRTLLLEFALRELPSGS